MTSLFIITMSQFCDTNEKYISQLHTKYVCTVKGSYFVIAMSRFCDTNEPDSAMNLCEIFFMFLHNDYNFAIGLSSFFINAMLQFCHEIVEIAKECFLVIHTSQDIIITKIL